MHAETIVIVGGGLAGAKAAESARTSGFHGRIVLFGAEPHAPYERPGLSKDYLRGAMDAARLAVHDDTFYRDHDIELQTSTTVVAIDRARGEVVTDRAERVAFTRLLIATGSEPRRLRAPGAQLEGIHYLRTIDDADRIRDALHEARHVAVVGGGWIGSEAAASARQLGLPVTLVDPRPAPLYEVLGEEIAATYRALHAEHGVELVLGTHVEAFRGTNRVEEVVTSDGGVIGADVVIVGVGAAPRTELASDAGLTVDVGVVVDQHLRTSDERIFAAGDVASAYHPFYDSRVRVEHWANALKQGLLAGRNLAGNDDVYDELPYFYSDQYDVGMEYVGHAPTWDHVVVRGEVRDRKFIAFWMRQHRVVAAMNVNVWDVGEPIRELITSRRRVDDGRLRDSDVSLDEVAVPATR